MPCNAAGSETQLLLWTDLILKCYIIMLELTVCLMLDFNLRCLESLMS